MHQGDNYEDVEQQTVTYEEKILKMLDRYKINQEVDKTVFEPYVGKTATAAISKIIKVSETSFKIVGKKILGLSAINENASIKIVKSATIGKVTGVMITTSNLPNISLSYSNATHKINQFVMKGDEINYIYKNKPYTANFNIFN